MRRNPVLLYGAVLLGVAGLALLVYGTQLDAAPPGLGPLPAGTPAALVQTVIVERVVTATPTAVPTLRAWPLTATPETAFAWPTATTDPSCAYGIREHCTWTTPPPAPTSAALLERTP